MCEVKNKEVEKCVNMACGLKYIIRWKRENDMKMNLGECIRSGTGMTSNFCDFNFPFD